MFGFDPFRAELLCELPLWMRSKIALTAEYASAIRARAIPAEGGLRPQLHRRLGEIPVPTDEENKTEELDDDIPF